MDNVQVLLAATLALLADADIPATPGMYQGDIVVPKIRNGIFSSDRWPQGVIPYEIKYNSFASWSRTNDDKLNAAMKEIMDHSCIRFVKRSNEKSYIQISNGGGCSSPVGKWRFGDMVHTVSLQEGGCWTHSTVVHELMHSIGLWHEQSRHDRDNYITINLQNVQEWAKYNFGRKFPNETDTYGVLYNYRSVMHYGRDAFTASGFATILPRDASMEYTIGNVPHGAESDYEKIRRIYECKQTYPRMPEAPIVPIPPCEDTYGPTCSQYLQQCRLQSYRWLWNSCARTCGFCSGPGPGPVPTTTTTTTKAPTTAPNVCQDDINDCATYRDRCSYDQWVQQRCERTCGICSTGGTGDQCKDEITYCDQYIDRCSYDNWVRDRCGKSCGICAKLECKDEITNCSDYKDRCSSDTWVKSRCRKSCGICKAGDECKDKITNCENYFDRCSYDTWVRERCEKSCGICGKLECKDAITYCNNYKDRCSYDTWVTNRCRKSCGLCQGSMDEDPSDPDLDHVDVIIG